MKISIIGAGAMGCLYASMLSARHDVTLYDVVPAVVDEINRHGILCREPDGKINEFAVRARLSGDCDGQSDLVILFVKDLYSRSALETNKALIGDKTLLLSLQNGMGNQEILEEFAPSERVLLGTTKHNCVTVAPARIYHSGSGITYIGSPALRHTTAKSIAKAFEDCGIEADMCESVRHLLWEKLFVNMTINPVTAILDAPIGVLYSDENLRVLTRKLIDEAVPVALADGEKFDATVIYENLMKTVKLLHDGRASMCQDIEKKRLTEIDFINGAVVRLGKKYGIPTPCHETIVQLVHAKEKMNLNK